MKKEHCLIDKVINDIKIAEDKMAILFITDSGKIIANADADCCSYTWIEHIELASFPAKVISVEDLEMPDLGSLEGCDVVAYYGLKITTDKGNIIIDYRNDSNGYYGGNLVFPDDSDYCNFYGGVYGQNKSEEKWIDQAADKLKVEFAGTEVPF